MSRFHALDSQAEFFRLILAVVGALLAIVGWLRFAFGAMTLR